jgi:hypothetical protein
MIKNGFHCPYCGSFHEEISPEFAGGSVTCTCGHTYNWKRILSQSGSNSLGIPVIKFKGRYEITMVTDVLNGYSV